MQRFLTYIRDELFPTLRGLGDPSPVMEALRRSELPHLLPASAEGVWTVFRGEGWGVWDDVVSPCLSEVLVEILSKRENPEAFLLDLVCDQNLQTPIRERAAVGLASRGDILWVDRLVEVLSNPSEPLPMVFPALIATLARREEARVEVWLMRLLPPAGCPPLLAEKIDRAQMLATLTRHDGRLLPEFLMKHAPHGELPVNERTLLRKRASERNWLAPILQKMGNAEASDAHPLMRLLEYDSEALRIWALREIAETLPPETSLRILRNVADSEGDPHPLKRFSTDLRERACQFASDLESKPSRVRKKHPAALPEDDSQRLRLHGLMHNAGMPLEGEVIPQNPSDLPELADLPPALVHAILRLITETRNDDTAPRWTLTAARIQGREGEEHPRDFGEVLYSRLRMQGGFYSKVEFMPGNPGSRVLYRFDRLLFLKRHEVWISPFGPFLTPLPQDLADFQVPFPADVEVKLQQKLAELGGIWIDAQTAQRELKGCPIWNYPSIGKNHNIISLLFPIGPP